MRGNECRLFALNQSDWFMLVGIKKMLSEKALTKVVVWAFEQTMYPCDMLESLLYSLASLRIVEHNLACSDSSSSVYLPEDGCPFPIFRCTNVITMYQLECFVLSKLFGKKATEVVLLISSQGLLHRCFLNEGWR